MTPSCYAVGCSKPSVHVLEGNSVVLVPHFPAISGTLEPDGASPECVSWTIRLCPDHYRAVTDGLLSKETTVVSTELHGRSLERRRSEERRAS